MHDLLSNSSGFRKPEFVGTKLQRKLRKMTKTAKALLGVELTTGPMQFSARQASRFAEVEMKYIRAVRKATPGECWSLKHRYLTVEDLHARQLAARRNSDAQVDKAVTKIGRGLVLAALDRLTTPATNGSATPTSNSHAPSAIHCT